MLMRSLFTLLVFVFFLGSLSAQSTAYVINGGPTLGLQKWDNGGDRQVLFKYHVALAIESVDNEDDKSSMFIQGGYHVKGSASRTHFLFTNGGAGTYTREYRFNNLSLAIGAKQKFATGAAGNARYFYYGALRCDYTLSTNIDELGTQFGYVDYTAPQIGYMNRWTFGLSIGGGYQFPIADLIGGQITLSICPDVTNQYRQPAIPNVINNNPYGGGGTITIPEKRIRNTAVEISVGLRLLHKVELVD